MDPNFITGLVTLELPNVSVRNGFGGCYTVGGVTLDGQELLNMSAGNGIGRRYTVGVTMDGQELLNVSAGNRIWKMFCAHRRWSL